MNRAELIAAGQEFRDQPDQYAELITELADELDEAVRYQEIQHLVIQRLADPATPWPMHSNGQERIDLAREHVLGIRVKALADHLTDTNIAAARELIAEQGSFRSSGNASFLDARLARALGEALDTIEGEGR